MSVSGRFDANVPAGISIGWALGCTDINSASRPNLSIQATFKKIPFDVLTGSLRRNASTGNCPNDVRIRALAAKPGAFQSISWRVRRRFLAAASATRDLFRTLDKMSSSDSRSVTRYSLFALSRKYAAGLSDRRRDGSRPSRQTIVSSHYLVRGGDRVGFDPDTTTLVTA